MQGGQGRCAKCGRAQESCSKSPELPEGSCPTCGAPLDTGALSEFARRLARFGLGATYEPLLRHAAELPDAK